MLYGRPEILIERGGNEEDILELSLDWIVLPSVPWVFLGDPLANRITSYSKRPFLHEIL
jgi:hypothetical protein